MPQANPLSPEQQQQLTDTGEGAKKIFAAARVAAFNGWTIGTFAVLSLLFGFTSPTGLVMGAGLGWVAWNEFKGRTRIRALDPTAPAFLGKNQLGLMGLIVVYCLVSIYRALTGPIPYIAEIEEVLGPVGDLVTSATVLVYVVVIVLTILFQGLNARYYFARRRSMEEYLAQTPTWIIELQRRLG